MHNPLADAVLLDRGIIYPTPELSSEIGVRRLWRRPDTTRAFVRVSDVVRDEKGNARSATVEYLDAGTTGLRWTPWKPDWRLCWDGFRFTLKHTPRAGLHIRIGIPVPDSPVDRHGYRTMEPTFVATVKIEANGILVLTPSSSLAGGYRLDELDRSDIEERKLLLNVFGARFGACEDEAKAILGLAA